MLAHAEHKGILTGISQEGVQVVRIHYSADPNKDPDTPQGQKWLETELEGYRGKQDPRWRKEMEIDFEAHGGQLLFPYLLQYEQQIFIKPYRVTTSNLFAGLDYGTRNPSAFEVLFRDYDGYPHVIWEYYETPKAHNESDQVFRARKGYKALSTAIKICPYFSLRLPIYADQSLWAQNQESTKGMRSVQDLFAEEGIELIPAQKGGDFACYERLDKDLWEAPNKPLFTIMQTCPWLWWELQRLRFDEYTEATQINQNLKEKIVDKDNHAWDALKYALMSIFNAGFFSGCDMA